MREERTYIIADTGLRLLAEAVYVQEELADFQVTEDAKNFGGPFAKAVADRECVTVEILEEKLGELTNVDIPEEQRVNQVESLGKLLVSAETILVYETEKRFVVRYRNPVSVYGYELSKEKNEARIYVTGKQTQENKDLMYSVRDSFFFYLQKQGKVVIHSASFVYKDKVWLISAPSGVGKSTHVKLWKEWGYGIEDFNGDIAACYVDRNGKAVAAGLPWCGTSGIYENKVLHLGGILLLKRGTESHARRLPVFEASIRLAARCVTPAWTKEQADSNISVTGTLTKTVCVGELTATPDRAAVIAAKALMDAYEEELEEK